MNFIGFKPTWKYLFMVFAIDFYDFAREHQKIKITFQNWTWNSIAVDYQAKISTLLLNSRPSSSSLQKLQAGMLFATYFYVQIILIRAPHLFVPFLKIRRSKRLKNLFCSTVKLNIWVFLISKAVMQKVIERMT